MITDEDMRGPLHVQQHPPFRVGIVQAQNAGNGTVRVQFPDRDNVISYWLPVITPNTQDNKFYWMPDVGSQVVVLMDEHDENGAVVGCIYSSADTVPGGASATTTIQHFSDGTAVTYDTASHALTSAVVSGGTAKVSTGKGNQVYLDAIGNLLGQAGGGATATVNTPAGNQVYLDTAGNVAMTAGAGGKVTFSNGGATADALALVSKLVAAFNAHVHTDPQGGNTGVPVTQWTATTIESATTAVTD